MNLHEPQLRGGDAKAGFTGEIRFARRLIHTRHWGFWTVEVAHQYRAFVEGATLHLGDGWAGMIENLDSVAQAPEVRDIRAGVLKLGVQRRMGAAAYVTGDSIFAKLQMRKISADGGVKADAFQTFDEGLAWLCSLDPLLAAAVKAERE